MIIPIKTHTQIPEDIPLNMAYRFMGLRNGIPTEDIEQITIKLRDELLSSIECKACYAVVDTDCSLPFVHLGSIKVSSKSLAGNLKGCKKAILMAATLGFGSELVRKKAMTRSSIEGLAADALCTSAIEDYCDKLCKKFSDDFSASGLKLRPRFSPGYGDLPLEFQTELLTLLNSKKYAGISLSDSLLMIPQKSVSAIIGLSAAGCENKIASCYMCGKKDCEFRLE